MPSIVFRLRLVAPRVGRAVEPAARRELPLGFRRQALHAEVLEFVHPVSGEPVRCEAPLPPDMQQLLRHLREDTAAHQEAERTRR